MKKARIISHTALYGVTGTIAPTDADPGMNHEASFTPDGETHAVWVAMREVEIIP